MSEAKSSTDSVGPELWSSDERFRTLMDSVPDAVITLNSDARVIEWNTQAELMFGWTRTEATGQPISELVIPPRMHEQHFAGLKRFHETGSGKIVGNRVEVTARRRDESEFPVELTVSTVDIDGETVFNGFVRDLSSQRADERKLARQTLEIRLLQQAGTLSATSDSFEDALRICVANLGEITAWPLGHVFVRNDAGNRMVSANIWYRAPDPNREFETFAEGTEEAVFERGQGLPGRVWESGEAIWITDVSDGPQFIRRGGSTGTITSAFAFPVKMASDVVAVIEFFHTRRVEPDQSLMTLSRGVGNQLGQLIARMRWQEERSRLAAIVDSSADAIIGKGPDGTIISWNSGAERIYGWTADEAIGRTDSIILPQGMARQESEILEAIRAGRRLDQFETRRCQRDGTVIPVSITVSPIRGRDNRIVGSSTIERDITARCLREAELREAHEAAEEANRVRGEFLANVSHELRTPMNAILGMLELGLQEDIAPALQDYLETARDSADVLLLLVNDILDFSRLEAGRFELAPAPFLIRDMLAEVVRTLSLRADEKGVEFVCNIDRSVPTQLVGDAMRLRQLVTNLTGNAIKFTERGEVVVDVSVRAADFPLAESAAETAESQAGRERHHSESNAEMNSTAHRATTNPGDKITLDVSVTDTGIGIAPEDQERIFAPFTQADASTTRQYSGTGLGLAICHELAGLMGGRVSLDSERGRGSRFSFTAVLTVGDPDDTEALREQVTIDELRNLPVLVVDDNQTNRRILEEMLTNWSMEPTVVESADQALRELKLAEEHTEPFRVVIVDALMPFKDGFMLLKEARAAGHLESATIMMISSADRQVFSERCDGLDISAYLEKPVSQSDLLHAIMTALKGPQLIRGSVNHITEVTRSLNILVAEDTSANQKVIDAILCKHGHHVTIANNGREAVDLLTSKSFDIVLMDVQMPTMDGLQATAAIRDYESAESEHAGDSLSRIPIIAMTAHAMRGDREKCLAAGMDDYIAKPIDSSLLIRLIAQYGRSSPATAEHQSRFRPKRKRDKQHSTADVTFQVSPLPAAIELSADRPAIDMHTALARVGDDPDLLNDMIDYFFEDSPGLLVSIRAHAESGDAEELARAAHSLKGLCANFDAHAAAEIAKVVEDVGLSGDLSSAPDAIRQLESSTTRVSKSLALWQAENA